MTMSVNENELLSAFIDGELQGAELDQVLNLIETNPEIYKRVYCYQLGSDVLHEHVTAEPDFDFSQRLATALTDEPVYSLDDAVDKPTAQIIPLKQTFWKQAAGFAVAASIGAIAVVGVMSNSQTMSGASLAGSANNHVQQVASTSGQRWTVDEPDVAEQLNTYLVGHNEHAGANGVFSYARVVSHGSE